MQVGQKQDGKKKTRGRKPNEPLSALQAASLYVEKRDGLVKDVKEGKKSKKGLDMTAKQIQNLNSAYKNRFS